VPVFVTFVPGLVVSGVVVTVVTSPLGVTVTVLAAPELIASTPAFCALRLIQTGCHSAGRDNSIVDPPVLHRLVPPEKQAAQAEVMTPLEV